MSTAFQPSLQFEHRQNKKARLLDYFQLHLGQKVSSQWLHSEFGSSVRTRISEINRDKFCPITIRNEYEYDPKADAEISHYWSEKKW